MPGVQTNLSPIITQKTAEDENDEDDEEDWEMTQQFLRVLRSTLLSKLHSKLHPQDIEVLPADRSTYSIFHLVTSLVRN